MSPASPGCSRLVEFNCHPELVEGSRFSRLRWLAGKATGFFDSVPLRFTSLRMTKVGSRASPLYRYVSTYEFTEKTFCSRFGGHHCRRRARRGLSVTDGRRLRHSRF